MNLLIHAHLNKIGEANLLYWIEYGKNNVFIYYAKEGVFWEMNLFRGQEIKDKTIRVDLELEYRNDVFAAKNTGLPISEFNHELYEAMR